MAWGLGTGQAGIGKFAKFNIARNKQDFRAAGSDCKISSWNEERNSASLRLLANAACVVASPTHYVSSTLYYPNILLNVVAISV
jgi:hypothetical protein